MRARSSKQRFPVAQWVEDLEILQTNSIEKHAKHSKRQDRSSWRLTSGSSRATESIRQVSSSSNNSREHSRAPSSSGSVTPSGPVVSDSRLSVPRSGFDHVPLPTNSSPDPNNSDNEPDSDADPRRRPLSSNPLADSRVLYSEVNEGEHFDLTPGSVQDYGSGRPSPLGTPNFYFSRSGASTPVLGARPEDGLLGRRDARVSMMSLASVDGIVKEKQDYNLQKVDPFFTDGKNEYADLFEKRLASLNGKNSEDQLCIEEFLEKSQKDWFNRYRDVRLGKSPLPSPTPSVFHFKIRETARESVRETVRPESPQSTGAASDSNVGQFLLPSNYVPPTGLKRFMLMKLGDWPVYSIFLAIVSQVPSYDLSIRTLTQTF